MTINQGLGTYSPLVNGKETLVRLYLSKPSCAGSGASIQVTGGTLTVKNGAATLGTVSAPTPVPVASAYPEIATFTVAPVADSTGDPKFVVPPNFVSQSASFTATFSATISYQQRASKSAAYASGSVTFTTRPGSTAPITASFDRPSNPLAVLFVPMGDGTKTYNTQWTAVGQQALQDGMTAAVAREYPLPSGIGGLGAAGGLRYAVAPTLIDLKRLNLLDASGKFCGNGANYDAIKAELAQFRLSYNTANPGAQANRVVGVVDPAVGIDGPAVNQPCFEGMAVVNSQEAWALALPGKAGQLIGLEMAHTMGLVPRNRESPFDGAHSQNVTAENPSANRRFNVVQRSFITTDRSLMKPSGTSPLPDNVNTLFEVPDFAFALCVLGGTVFTECQTYGQPGSVNAAAPVGSTIAFVMSGTTDSNSTASLCSTCTGAAAGTQVVESYFSSSDPLTIPSSTSTYRFVQRNAAGAVISNQGVLVTFQHSEHGTGTATNNHSSGLFAFALPFQTTADRVELWKGAPGASGSLLLYARNRTATPVVTDFSVGTSLDFLQARKTSNLLLSTFTVTNTNDSGAGSLRQAIDDANTNAGADTIHFSIGTGAQTIQPTAALPAITDPVTIDGTTQPGYAGTPLIEIDGNSAGASTTGLLVNAGSTTIRGVAVNRFTDNGISFNTGSGGVLEGSYVGLGLDGTSDRGNTNDGVDVNGTASATIGGTSAGARNVISGNGREGISLATSGASVVQGNFIGTNAAGTAAVSNGLRGVLLNGASGQTIGGSAAGEGNVISGNANVGIMVASGSSNTIQGNRIGTNAPGTSAVPNGPGGIQLIGGDAPFGADSNTIGGTAAGAGNLISGNTGPGILLNSGGTSPSVSNNVIQGNLIGTDVTGTSALGNSGINGRGISILNDGGIGNNTIGGTAAGAANTIAFNAASGIGIQNDPGNVGDAIRANAIHSNGGLGIDLGVEGVTANDPGDDDNGANNLQNYPVLGTATTTQVDGTLNSAANTTYRLEFFDNTSCDGSGNGEGQVFLGGQDESTDGSGNVTTFTFTYPAPVASGHSITATATDPNGNTSEFSACATIGGGGGGGTQPGPTFTVNTNSDTPADTGCTLDDCTLREAITAANGDPADNTIEFDITGSTAIALASPLPAISDTVAILGGTQPAGRISVNGSAAGATADGLVLATGSSGSEIRSLDLHDFTGAGIRVGSAANTIASNMVRDALDGIVVSGSDATGNVIGNDVAPDQLGAVDYALGNVLISNDSDGLEIAAGANAKVAGNFIGTDRDGTDGLGNFSTGIRVASSGNQLGPGNTVIHNGSIDTGIFVASGSGNRIVANSIHDNLGLGISLAAGANGDLSHPQLGSAHISGGTTTVSGKISSVSPGGYFVEFFRNTACDGSGFGEGEAYLDFITVTVSGSSASFSASLGGLALGDVVTATLTHSGSPEDTSEFSNCVTVTESLPQDQEEWSATATDDNAADARLDGFLDCPGQPVQVIFVGRAPDDVNGNTASWSGTVDTSLAPPNCAVKIAVNDGFTRPPITATGTETADTGRNPVVAAISSPRAGSSVLQYGLIPLRGSIFNAQGVLAPSSHEWSLAGPGGFTRSGTGPIVDLQPPTNGWPVGPYTATLKKAGSTDLAERDTVSFTVVADGDNDGIPKSVDDSCVVNGGDSDPTNAFLDKDGDGIANVDDPQPCIAATSYTASVDVNPDPLPVGSSGNPITAYVRVPGRNVAQVLANTVRITAVAGEDVSADPRFQNNIGWTVSNGVGTAKFDRQKLAQWLAQRNIHNQVVSITVSGSSGAPTWSFSGSDSVLLQG